MQQPSLSCPLDHYAYQGTSLRKQRVWAADPFFHRDLLRRSLLCVSVDGSLKSVLVS